MTAIDIGRLALQARINLIRVGAPRGVIAILFLLGATTWIWLAINARNPGQQEAVVTPARQERGVPLDGSVVKFDAEQNLRNFYEALGERSEVERYLKAMFAIAAHTGLSLDQGEYQAQADKNSSTYRYQILLPVKGSYGAIRRFCEQTLLALPFASLDEMSVKRESVGENALDVNLRFTFYLKDTLRVPQKAEAAK